MRIDIISLVTSVIFISLLVVVGCAIKKSIVRHFAAYAKKYEDKDTGILKLRPDLTEDQQREAAEFLQDANETPNKYEYCLQNLTKAQLYFENDFLDILLQYCCFPGFTYATSEREQRNIPSRLTVDQIRELREQSSIRNPKVDEFLTKQLSMRNK